MRIQHIITINAAIVAAIFIAGCSKSASPPPQAAISPEDIHQGGAAGLAILQQQYLAESNQIQQAQTKLVDLAKTSRTNVQSYLDGQRDLEKMIELHQLLYTKIESLKHDNQTQGQGKN